MEDLTRDNTLLSGPIFDGSCAVNCTTSLPQLVVDLVRESLAENTRRAYAADLAHFEAWGGSIPASDIVVASYLAVHADLLSPATLVRRLATISKAHTGSGLLSPTGSELVRATMRGIKKRQGTAQDQARPLLRDDLMYVLDKLGDSLRDTRDRALLLLGFAGGFRRSELIGLDVTDIEHVRQGIVVHLRRSKTDQLGAGRKIGVPLGRTRHCPVAALDQWIKGSAIQSGPLFTSVNRGGHVVGCRLSGEAVSLVVKQRVAAAGFNTSRFSGHSLRAGFATSAAQAGVSSVKIRAQTGHASDAMLIRYIREGDLFLQNAAGALL